MLETISSIILTYRKPGWRLGRHGVSTSRRYVGRRPSAWECGGEEQLEVEAGTIEIVSSWQFLHELPESND